MKLLTVATLVVFLVFVDCRAKDTRRKTGNETPGQNDLDILRLPENTVVTDGGTVTLRCAVSDPEALHSLQWWEFAYSETGLPISENSNIGSHPEKERYTIVQDAPGEYSLRISPVVMADGGTYLCTDAWGNPALKNRHFAQLTVLGPINCTTTLPQEGIVLDGDYHTNECHLNYKGGLIPNMTWSGTPEFQSLYTATPTQVWAGMQYYVNRNMDTRAHEMLLNFTDYFYPVDGDMAANVPTYTYFHRERQMFVYWAPTDMYHEPVKEYYEVGDVLTCFADAFPSPDYVWQNLRTAEFTEGREITVAPEWLGFNQSLRCEARNVIAGIIFSANYFTPVDVPVPTSPTTATTTSASTLPPAVSSCLDLTGAWESFAPSRASLCIKLNVTNNGYLVGLARNHTDTIWVDIVGRTTGTSFEQVAFAGIWPLEMGVSSFVGECHRCFGIERIIAHLTNRVRGSPCGVAGPARHTAEYQFFRSSTLTCPNLF